jgi:hypothetical protein
MYIGKLDSIELIRISLSPIERGTPFQLLSFFSNPSYTIRQSLFDSLR